MEIALATTRKLLFVHKMIPKLVDDLMKGEQWKACNNLVIAWIMNSISDSIADSILYIEPASKIWRHLERRFVASNGSRKYKLNKDVYNLRQNSASINEYYARMKGIWEELSAMKSCLDSQF